jgi:hypothetical protein
MLISPLCYVLRGGVRTGASLGMKAFAAPVLLIHLPYCSTIHLLKQPEGRESAPPWPGLADDEGNRVALKAPIHVPPSPNHTAQMLAGTLSMAPHRMSRLALTLALLSLGRSPGKCRG